MTTATTSAPAELGFFEDLQYLSGSALSQRLDQLKASGATWARFQMIWSTVQAGGPNSYNWGAYDELVLGLLRRGIRPLAVLGTTPSWSRPAGCDVETCEPADPAAFAAFAAAAAARYRNYGLRAWEIWNEPNLSTFYKPTPDPARYTALLRAAGAAIKAVDPGATIVSGGLAPTDYYADGLYTRIAPVDFLSQMYAAGAQGSFDAVGWHPYTFPWTPGRVHDRDAWYQLYGTATNVRSLMIANGDGGKRVWATEFGAHTYPQGEGYVTEQEQAALLDRGISLWQSLSWAGPMIVYRYQDTGLLGDREQFFGLTHADGTAKPALHIFEAYATG